MSYGVVASVRNLMGKPDVTDVTDAEIQTFIDYGDAQVKNETGKSDWSSLDIAYPAVVEASNYFASSRGREMRADKEGISDNHYQRALDICARIVKNGIPGSEGGIVIKSQKYRSYPLNPDALPYRSVKPGSIGVGPVAW